MRAIALFLGAGFSKPWGLPLAGELLPDSEEKWALIIKMFQRNYQKELAESVQKSWLKYRNECKNSVDIFAQALQLDKRGAMDLPFADLARFLALRLGVMHSGFPGYFGGASRYTSHHIQQQRNILSCYRELVEVLEEYSLEGIVTTNYDLVVEKILGPSTKGKLGGFNYGRQGQPAQGKHQINSQRWWGPVTIDGTIPLLKLHGSLNWALSDKEDIDVWVDCRPSLSRKYRPLIVPPHDSSHDKILSQIRLKALEVLSSADVWIFCGYSFPDHDIDKDVGKLLRASAYILRRVVILNPHAEGIEKKVRDILNASVPELEVKCGPPLGDKLTRLKFRSLISGNDSVSE